MRKFCLAFLFLMGGFSHEIRNPVSCNCITASQDARPKRRRG